MFDRIPQLLTTALVAVIAGSLAGVTSAALAQDDEAPPIHERVFLYVEGVSLVAGTHLLGYVGTDPARDVFTGLVSTSDPRVTGDWYWAWTLDESAAGVGPWWGECGIDGPDGQWRGICAGVR
jgi:hypothetical protein